MYMKDEAIPGGIFRPFMTRLYSHASVREGKKYFHQNKIRFNASITICQTEDGAAGKISDDRWDAACRRILAFFCWIEIIING
jgi:hypothetical protein